MKVPRDLKGRELVGLLGREFGYTITRQTGSHIRLLTESGGRHHLSVPDHAPMKLGTLMGIVGDVALHFRLSKEQVCERLFDKT